MSVRVVETSGMKIKHSLVNLDFGMSLRVVETSGKKIKHSLVSLRVVIFP